MGKDEDQTLGPAGVQVFELTMDNPENQDELNRQLHKPGESNKTCPAIAACKVPDSTPKSEEMNSGL